MWSWEACLSVRDCVYVCVPAFLHVIRCACPCVHVCECTFTHSCAGVHVSTGLGVQVFVPWPT